MIEGHCLCGAVRLAVAECDARIGACHCRICQRWAGGLSLSFDAVDVTVTGDVALYQSSAFAERAFCPKCGSHLWIRDTDAPEGRYDLLPGLFDAAKDWPLRGEIYTDRAFSAIRLEGGHTRATRAEYEAKNAHIKGDAL
ncbi:MAG: GFA family protein [Albidovulum sp.]